MHVFTEQNGWITRYNTALLTTSLVKSIVSGNGCDPNQPGSSLDFGRSVAEVSSPHPFSEDASHESIYGVVIAHFP